MSRAQRHTDIAAQEGRRGGTQQIFKRRRPTPYLLYTIFHDFVYLLLKNGTPFHIPCLELCIPFN